MATSSWRMMRTCLTVRWFLLKLNFLSKINESEKYYSQHGEDDGRCTTPEVEGQDGLGICLPMLSRIKRTSWHWCHWMGNSWRKYQGEIYHPNGFIYKIQGNWCPFQEQVRYYQKWVRWGDNPEYFPEVAFWQAQTSNLGFRQCQEPHSEEIYGLHIIPWHRSNLTTGLWVLGSWTYWMWLSIVERDYFENLCFLS